jgi:hypothetical protein
LFDYPLILSICSLYYPLNDLIPLSLLASDGHPVVNDIVQLDIVLTDYFELSVHWVLLHIGWPVGLGKTQGRIEQGVH